MYLSRIVLILQINFAVSSLQSQSLFSIKVSFQFGIIYLHSFKASFNPRVVSDFSLSFANDSNGVSRFNMSGLLKSNLTFPIVSFSLRVKGHREPDEIEYPYEVLKSTINVCKVSKGVFGSFLVPYVLGNLKQHTNVTVFCPFYAGSYYAKDFPVPNDEILPIVPSFVEKLIWEFTIVVKGKVAKKMVQFGSVKAYGVLIPNKLLKNY
jgi:hypothetical protein